MPNPTARSLQNKLRQIGIARQVAQVLLDEILALSSGRRAEDLSRLQADWRLLFDLETATLVRLTCDMADDRRARPGSGLPQAETSGHTKAPLVQDAREVNTKRGKTIVTAFFPVGDQPLQIVSGWVDYLRTELQFGPES